MSSQKEDDLIETAFLVAGLLLFGAFLGIRSCVNARSLETTRVTDVAKAVTHE